MKHLWPRLRSRGKDTGIPQSSKLLALPDEILDQIIQEVFSFIFIDYYDKHYRDWHGLPLVCRQLYILTRDVWQHFYFPLPASMDLTQWAFRRRGKKLLPYQLLTLYLSIPGFVRMPGAIRLPPVYFIHYLQLHWEACWIIAVHPEDRIAAMPELTFLKVIAFGPIGYLSPWTSSETHHQDLQSYHSKAISVGCFERAAVLWSRLAAKCPSAEGFQTFRQWNEAEIGTPKSTNLSPDVRASTFKAVKGRTIILDNALFNFMQDLIVKRLSWEGKYKHLVEKLIAEHERRYRRELAHCVWR